MSAESVRHVEQARRAFEAGDIDGGVRHLEQAGDLAGCPWCARKTASIVAAARDGNATAEQLAAASEELVELMPLADSFFERYSDKSVLKQLSEANPTPLTQAPRKRSRGRPKLDERGRGINSPPLVGFAQAHWDDPKVTRMRKDWALRNFGGVTDVNKVSRLSKMSFEELPETVRKRLTADIDAWRASFARESGPARTTARAPHFGEDDEGRLDREVYRAVERAQRGNRRNMAHGDEVGAHFEGRDQDFWDSMNRLLDRGLIHEPMLGVFALEGTTVKPPGSKRGLSASARALAEAKAAGGVSATNATATAHGPAIMKPRGRSPEEVAAALEELDTAIRGELGVRDGGDLRGSRDLQVQYLERLREVLGRPTKRYSKKVTAKLEDDNWHSLYEALTRLGYLSYKDTYSPVTTIHVDDLEVEQIAADGSIGSRAPAGNIDSRYVGQHAPANDRETFPIARALRANRPSVRRFVKSLGDDDEPA